jgi:hypothetical protein
MVKGGDPCNLTNGSGQTIERFSLYPLHFTLYSVSQQRFPANHGLKVKG